MYCGADTNDDRRKEPPNPHEPIDLPAGNSNDVPPSPRDNLLQATASEQHNNNNNMAADQQQRLLQQRQAVAAVTRQPTAPVPATSTIHSTAKRLTGCIDVCGKPFAQPRSITCHM